MKNNKPKVGLYDPYLDTLGGGEQYVLYVLKALEDEGYDITVYWHEDLQTKIKEKFGITYRNLHIDKSGFHGDKSAISRWWHLGKYDIMFYITDGSYFFSGAKKNFIYAMVPSRKLYDVKGVEKFKQSGWNFIANSHFTASHLLQWDIQSRVHYPCLPERMLTLDSVPKEKIILNVGRFFGHLHKKNHTDVIYAFNRLIENSAFADYRLILAGGLRDEDKEYFEEVQQVAKKNKSITLMPNVPYEELVKLYQRATYYWHFTGLGVNEREHPELVEHLGITPLEAMAAGAVVCAFRAGGPREIIEDGTNGFLFSSIDELISIMKKTKKNELKDISDYGRSYVRAHFSYNVFKNELLRIIES